MKDVLAIITPAYANAFGEAANYAFVLAGLFEAHVTVLITEIEPDAPAPMSAPDLMQGGGDRGGVLFGSGHPIILVPPSVHTPAAERALVAWDGTRSAVRSLHDALPILTHAREVVVVTVTDDKELRAVRSGDKVCRYLSRWGVQARFELLQRGSRNVGDVLLGRAAEIEAALVVMGGFGHAREREFLFGSATRDIFQSTLQTAVLLSH